MSPTPTSVPVKLPRGRHGLTREQVTGSQRIRMLWAMGEAVAEHGYAKTSVAEVLRRAGVSRETFYEHYANKEECFLAAYDGAAQLLLDAITRSNDGAASGSGDRIEAMLAGYLGVLSQESAIARTFLIEVYGAGPAALARRAEVQERFIAALAEILGAETAAQYFACEFVVAAASALVTQRVCAGDADDLSDLHAPLMEEIKSVLSANGLLR